MLYTDLTRKAFHIAYQKHFSQIGRDGFPYIFHPYHLAEQMGDDEYAVCVALLHDVAEDTDMTLDQIEAEEFPREVMDALILLTHVPDEEYVEKFGKEAEYLEVYIPKIKKNSIARKVKLADLAHNSDSTRPVKEIPGDVERREKYRKAKLIILQED